MHSRRSRHFVRIGGVVVADQRRFRNYAKRCSCGFLVRLLRALFPETRRPPSSTCTTIRHHISSPQWEWRWSQKAPSRNVKRSCGVAADELEFPLVQSSTTASTSLVNTFELWLCFEKCNFFKKSFPRSSAKFSNFQEQSRGLLALVTVNRRGRRNPRPLILPSQLLSRLDNS